MTPTSTSTVSTTSFSKKDSLRFEELKISPVERRVKRQLRFLTSAKTSGKKPLSLPNESLFLGLDSENMTYLDEKSHQQLLSNVSKTEKHHSKDMTSDRTPIVPVGDMDCSNKYANIASDAIIDMYHPDIGQILDFLFIGSIEAAYNDSLLNKFKVRSVVDVSNVDFTDVSSYRKAISPSQTQNFRTRLCIGLSQEGRDNISVFFDDVNKFIEGARKANRKVLVHCFRGRSRGPAMIVQYLMQFHGMNLDNAHRFICEKWPRVDIHPNYFKKLRQLDKNLKSSSKRREHNPLFRRTAWS
ncbi:dual specificity protein phosphatase 8-like [Limulus polyphemus]|uniref:protein-tyrosine-phosphatase n=1 Tax=Limulus polyphemus TaxID=6850 RepID=A0ABM1SY34_LIMPO|nr:dual specificity protein phosphatase 8-like [Limulus polyphemus]